MVIRYVNHFYAVYIDTLKKHKCDFLLHVKREATWVSNVSFLTSAINCTKAWKSFLKLSSNSDWPLSPTALRCNEEEMNRSVKRLDQWMRKQWKRDGVLVKIITYMYVTILTFHTKFLTVQWIWKCIPWPNNITNTECYTNAWIVDDKLTYRL